MKPLVNIPCYFNNIKEREVNFYVILQQYLNLGYKIVICWMNGQELKVESENITVIKNKPVNASKARNILLKEFYKSNMDYAIFSDDDTYLKNSIDSFNFDCLSLTNDYHKGITPTEKISSGILLLSNFKKKYNLEIYFDENLKANQDLDFGITLNKLGIKTYRKSTKDVIINRGISSMFENNINKLNRKQKSLDYIKNKHGKYN